MFDLVRALEIEFYTQGFLFGGCAPHALFSPEEGDLPHMLLSLLRKEIWALLGCSLGGVCFTPLEQLFPGEEIPNSMLPTTHDFLQSGRPQQQRALTALADQGV